MFLQVQQLSKLEVEDLLKKGAYGALMDEEDEGSKFCEEDIDQILQRRTQTITIQSEGKGSTFAKVEISFLTVNHLILSKMSYVKKGQTKMDYFHICSSRVTSLL